MDCDQVGELLDAYALGPPKPMRPPPLEST